MARIYDRWWKMVDGEKVPTKAHGIARRWQIRYLDPDTGKEATETFKRSPDAKRRLEEVTAAVVTGQFVAPMAGRVTLKAFAEEWLERQVVDAPTRLALASRLRTHVYPQLGRFELRAIKPSTVQAWVRGRSNVLAASYVALILGHLKAILSAAVDDRVIASNPAASRAVKAPRAERRQVVPWTVKQVQAIASNHPERYAAIPIVGAGSGMRQGELFGLALPDVDFLGRTIHVRQQVRLLQGKPTFAPPKGGREREIPLPEAVAVALAEHLRVFPALDVTLPWLELDGSPVTRTLIFTGPRGAAVNKNPFNERVWKPALRAAGMEPSRETGMHQLRHHYSSVLLDAGVSIAALSRYLGHADPAVTLRVYSHMMPDTEDRARAAIDEAHAGAESERNAEGGRR